MAEKALLPLFPLDLVLVPGEVLPLHIFEPRYRVMVSNALADRTEFGVVRQSGDSLEQVGCAATVREVTQRFDDGRFNIRAAGSRRFLIRMLDSSEECIQGAVEYFADDSPAQVSSSAVGALIDVATRVRRLTDSPQEDWNPNHPWLSFRIAAGLPLELDTKQRLLSSRSEVQRVELLTGYLQGVVAKRARREERERLARGNGRLRH